MLAFTCIVCALAGWCLRITTPRARNLLLAATIMLACYAEPAAVVSCWWGRLLSLPASRFQLVTPTTHYLAQFTPAEHRVYTRVGLFAEEFNAQPRLDAPNLPALYGLHNVAGMEPLLFERFSRALGGVGPDSVTPRAGFPSNNDDLFAARSHVLDILNTTHVVSFAGLKTFEEPFVYHEGVGVSALDLTLSLAPGASARLTGGGAETDTLALVTSLANSIEVADDEPVARLRFDTVDGHSFERVLRAGADTAEWAHERADVRALMKHRLAPVFDARPADAANSFNALRYWARLKFDAPARIKEIEITNVTRATTLAVWRASLYSTRTGRATPLAVDTRSEFWTTVYTEDGVQILQNARALPRAWLVAAAEAVDGEEALRRIRGESARDFDPQRTALLEVRPEELPQLSGAAQKLESLHARVAVYEPNKLLIETDADAPTVLVVSEIFYPGWEATIDGARAPLLAADYLLRSVALPAGQHRVEMRYVAPAARTGALISALTLLLIAGLAIYARRRKS